MSYDPSIKRLYTVVHPPGYASSGRKEKIWIDGRNFSQEQVQAAANTIFKRTGFFTQTMVQELLDYEAEEQERNDEIGDAL